MTAIDDLIAALKKANPKITIQQNQSTADVEDTRTWSVKHPDAFTDVQVQSETGAAPFVIASDFSPPTVVKSVDAAARMIVQRLGLGIA